MYRHTLFIATVLTLFALVRPAASDAAIEGRVYLDANQNGQPDADEPGVADVLVSDGRAVVVTDSAGHYRLDASGPSLVWMCVPRDRAASGSFWQASDGADRHDFGLVARPQSDEFAFLQITDTHVGRDDIVKLFAQRVGEMPVPAAFVVNTGDLVGGVDVVAPEKARAQYDRYLGAAASFTVPIFHLPGNHEHVAINFQGADPAHPLFGKGLYRQLLGPTYYSWDWAGVHFLALDGTSLPYQEKLGDEQLAWLRADLSHQPAEKPLVLFCHQSLPHLRDSAAISEILKGRNVLAGFCGHLHSTFTTQLGEFPVYHTGALSGAWWSGPNPDGTPQGFRLVQIKGGSLKTAYTSREGTYPLYVATPLASSVKKDAMEFEVVLVDFGRAVKASAAFDGRAVPLEQVAREDWWSVWKGSADTRQAYDGDRVLDVTAQLDGAANACAMRYLVVNGRVEPYQADAAATLTFQVRGIDAADAVLLGGEPLGVIPADTPKDTTLSMEIPRERLGKLNRVTLRAVDQGASKDAFSVGPVWLEYGGKRIYDLRYPTFERHSLGGNDPNRVEKDLYFCLPAK